MTITLGTWLGPLACTIVSFLVVWMFGPRMDPKPRGMYPDFVGAFLSLLAYLVATIFSLIAWLIWALV